MVLHSQNISFLLTAVSLLNSANAFAVCPLLGPNFPPPKTITTSSLIKDATKNLTAAYDKAMATGNLLGNPITPNTTSFSVALFTVSQPGQINSTQDPFFYQYHYTAPSLRNTSSGVQKVDANSVYRIGTLTQVFNVWTLLVNKGEQYLDRPVTDFVPELAMAAENCSAFKDPVSCVDWCEVTLRELGSHLSGIGRDYGFADLANTQLPTSISNSSGSKPPCGALDSPCSRVDFFAGLTQRAPVFAPGTTPIFSDAAFQILAYALESITQTPFTSLFASSITTPLNLRTLSFTAPTSNSTAILPSSPFFPASLGAATPSLGLYSSLHDLAAAGRAILSSTLLSPATTRRWLKPATLTSNLVNTVGMPWQIYSARFPDSGNAPIRDTYTYGGTLGPYASYLGLVPNYNVGFAILAADTSGSAPDLNGHADAVADLIGSLETLAVNEALGGHAGTYGNEASGARLTIEQSYSPHGLNVTAFVGSNGTDLRARIAGLKGIEGGAGALSFRLFPTNLGLEGKYGSESESESEGSRAFRAAWQDKEEVDDAGTPTCVSWQDVDGLVLDGEALDRFVFRYEGGKAVGVDVPGFGLKLRRTGV